ncbi:MAG: hypothetical protein ACYDDV_05630 [Methanoregula sp.]
MEIKAFTGKKTLMNAVALVLHTLLYDAGGIYLCVLRSSMVWGVWGRILALGMVKNEMKWIDCILIFKKSYLSSLGGPNWDMGDICTGFENPLAKKCIQIDFTFSNPFRDFVRTVRIRFIEVIKNPYHQFP